MLTSTNDNLNTNKNSIKLLVRSALAFGVLSTTAEAQINLLVTKGTLSSQEWLLVAVLRDAIQDGRVHLEDTPSYSNC
jgi:hypothetical protein